MSSLCKVIARTEPRVVQTGLRVCFYSNETKDPQSPYKIVKGARRNAPGPKNDNTVLEGGANWELLAPRGNRFYLPNSIGTAWSSQQTTVPFNADASLEELIDFDSRDRARLHINARACPILLKRNLQEIFPAPEVISKEGLTIITLAAYSDTETGAKHFVLAAREIASRLRNHGYWADFMNPFSGKPFYSYSISRLYSIDNRFRGLGMRLEKVNDCLIISSDNEDEEKMDQVKFRGCVFTNAAPNLALIQSLVID